MVLTVVLTVLTYLVPMPAAIIVDDPNWTYFTRDSYPQIAESIGGPVLKALFAFSSCCTVAGLFISGIFCESFQLAGMGEAQLLPACFAWRSTQFDAPFVSVGVTAVFTIALLGVDFDDLLPMTTVQLMIMLTAIRLRKLLPYIPRPTKVPGGKVSSQPSPSSRRSCSAISSSMPSPTSRRRRSSWRSWYPDWPTDSTDNTGITHVNWCARGLSRF